MAKTIIFFLVVTFGFLSMQANAEVSIKDIQISFSLDDNQKPLLSNLAFTNEDNKPICQIRLKEHKRKRILSDFELSPFEVPIPQASYCNEDQVKDTVKVLLKLELIDVQPAELPLRRIVQGIGGAALVVVSGCITPWFEESPDNELFRTITGLTVHAIGGIGFLMSLPISSRVMTAVTGFFSISTSVISSVFCDIKNFGDLLQKVKSLFPQISLSQYETCEEKWYARCTCYLHNSPEQLDTQSRKMALTGYYPGDDPLHISVEADGDSLEGLENKLFQVCREYGVGAYATNCDIGPFSSPCKKESWATEVMN